MNTEQNQAKQKPTLELLIILVFGIVVYILAASYDILERIVVFSRNYERVEIDEFITVLLFIAVALAFFSAQRWKEARNANTILLQHNKDLQTTLYEIRQLKRIIPICAKCKQIRDDEGFWHQVESYISDHSEAEFSHSICPECMNSLYPELVKKEE